MHIILLTFLVGGVMAAFALASLHQLEETGNDRGKAAVKWGCGLMWFGAVVLYTIKGLIAG